MTTIKSIGKLLGIGLFVLGFVFAVAPTEQVLSQTASQCTRDSAGKVSGGKICETVFTALDRGVALNTQFKFSPIEIVITPQVVNSHVLEIPGVGEAARADMLTYIASGGSLDTLLEFAQLQHKGPKGGDVNAFNSDQLAWVSALFKLRLQ